MRSDVEIVLTCEECGLDSGEDARGWRIYLADDAELVTYCPSCAAAEFGEKGTL